jgi:uncharacterized protein (UPF0332 family)
MKEFARDQWRRARKTLNSAEQLAESDPDSAASRAYYAAFQAVTALFAIRGREFTKHTEVRAAVHRDLVKAGEWDAQIGRDFDFLLDLRETGDYGGVAHVSSGSAGTAVESARRILNAVLLATPELADEDASQKVDD